MYNFQYFDVEKSRTDRYADPRATFVNSMDGTQAQPAILRTLMSKLGKRRIGR